MSIRPDEIVEQASVKLVTETSRRGFLSLLGKTVLGLAVGSLIEILLPVDRSVQIVEASGHSCSAGRNCGMSGFPCACCGGTTGTCPPNTTKGSYWSVCCNVGSFKLVRYYDCCYNGVSCCGTGAGGSCCPGCNWCTNSPLSNWCGSAGNCYKCTLSVIVGNC